MKKVKFDARYGHMQALVLGKKTQFHSVEFNLIRYFTNHYPSAKVESLDIPIDFGEKDTITIHLTDGASFQYSPKYRIGEILKVTNTNVEIRITGIRIERLCNPTAQDVLNEGFDIIRNDGVKFYCYFDIDELNLIHFRSHHQTWISQLYRLYDSDLVLNNTYTVVYEFELIKNV